MTKEQSDSHKQKVEPSGHYVKTGIFIVAAFQLLMLFMYGFFTSYTLVVYTTRLQYILTNALAVLGFGLLLVHFKYSIKQTLIIALIVCAVNVQMGPLLQQFWYNVFIAGFNKGFTPSGTNIFPLVTDTANQDVKNISLGFVRIATYTSISLLVALSSVVGRIGILNTFIVSILFNIGWNLSYYLNYLIYYSAGPYTKTFMIVDDYQGSRVFMFGAGFGIGLMILYNKFNRVIRDRSAQFTDSFSSVLTLLGTAFVLSLFYFVLDTYSPQNKTYALLNIYFAFSGSIVSSIAISCIIDGVITFHQINMSILSGALQISIIGGFIRTPYVAMLVGAFAGIVTAILSRFVQTKLNSTEFRDTKGVIVVYLVNTFLCSYFICPIIIKAYKNVDSTLDYNEGFHMIYTSISLGIGLLSGLVAAIFRSCIKEDNNFKDVEFFNGKYMNHREIPPPPVRQAPPVAEAPSISTFKKPEQETLAHLNATSKIHESGLSIVL